jgi:hypothetical protein
MCTWLANCGEMDNADGCPAKRTELGLNKKEVVTALFPRWYFPHPSPPPLEPGILANPLARFESSFFELHRR